jgi:DinB family protein
MKKPDPSEHAPYYSRYIDLVMGDNIVQILDTQLDETDKFLKSISSEKSLHQYAPEKWTIREVISHVNDAERVFAYRALWFARRLPEALPSFDQEVSVPAAKANEIHWNDLLEDFSSVRRASLSLFKTLSPEAWSYSGVASDSPVTVRALAYIIAGHTIHHLAVIEDRYL